MSYRNVFRELVPHFGGKDVLGFLCATSSSLLPALYFDSPYAGIAGLIAYGTARVGAGAFYNYRRNSHLNTENSSNLYC